MVPLVTFIAIYGFLIIKYPLKTFRAFVDFIQPGGAWSAKFIVSKITKENKKDI